MPATGFPPAEYIDARGIAFQKMFVCTDGSQNKQHEQLSEGRRCMIYIPSTIGQSYTTTSFDSIPVNFVPVIGLRPTSPNYLFECGMVGRIHKLRREVVKYVSRGRFDIAERMCTKNIHWLRRKYDHLVVEIPNTFNILATVYETQGKHLEAACALYDALIDYTKLTTDQYQIPLIVPATRSRLALLFAKNGRFEDAEVECKRAAHDMRDINDQFALHTYNLAVLYHLQGKFSDAKKSYTTIVDTLAVPTTIENPNLADALYNLASLSYEQGNISDAQRYYNAWNTIENFRMNNGNY